MAEIKLKVPFSQKDQVKILGARWNPVERLWYVPNGVDPTPFRPWMDKSDIDFDEDLDKQSETEVGQALHQYLATIAQAVYQVGDHPQWVRGEISQIHPPKGGHIYLELVEQSGDGSGRMIARASSIIWKSSAEKIMTKFKEQTGSELTDGMKVLFQVRAQMNPLYGFKLVIEDVDPAYTLGDMAAKLREIRKSLKAEGLYDLNRKYDLPEDFFKVAVIGPEGAAGVGDFRREAEILEKYALCEFHHFSATFQGIEAPKSILRALKEVKDQHKTQGFDALVVIRGGGAVTDLAWLNDKELAQGVCKFPLPILTGIGHQRDSTILDEVAKQSFDTPSKVSHFIFQSIVSKAAQLEEDFSFICSEAKDVLGELSQVVETYYKQIESDAKLLIEKFENALIQAQHLIAERAFSLFERARDMTTHLMSLVKELGRSRLLLLEEEIQRLQRSVVESAERSVKQAQSDMSRWMEEILGLGPKATLRRGFGIVHDPSGRTVTRKSQAEKEKKLKLEFYDGHVNVTVQKNES